MIYPMKKLVISILVLTGFNSFAQTIRFSDLNGDIPKGKFESYISKDGETYSVGDTIKIGNPSGSDGKFLYISTYGLGSAIFNSTTLGASGTNTMRIIQEIICRGSKVNKKVYLTAKSSKGSTGGLLISLENAIDKGEIIAKGMTSDQALEELKKAKDKLDLGLITQEEYDKIKADLSKYIK